MKQNINLLDGPIFPSLTKLAVPIMATSLIQMAYNMTDMIWIGRVGSNALAAVGAAGMYMWLSNGLATLARIGGQVKVAYSIGEDKYDSAIEYAKSALQLAVIFGLIYGFICVTCSGPLIGFFKLNSPDVISDARLYLAITCGGVVFSFLNQVFTGIMTAMGNSKTSLYATAVGLLVNILLDPVLIFGVGPFPKLGVTGAAIATVIAQLIVTLAFLYAALKDTLIFRQIKLFSKPDGETMISLVKIGFPISIQSMIFTGISMVIARMVAGFGDAAIAVQKVGSQIESISWMTSDGFAAALNSFVAQNHGASNPARVKKGYSQAMIVVAIWGIFCTVLLTLCPGIIFKVFIPDAKLLGMGGDYLRILGISQLFMAVEIATAGAFAGLGNTIPPSLVGITLTAARIPMAMFLITTPLGLNGIWWSVTISSICKGVILLIWFLGYIKKKL